MIELQRFQEKWPGWYRDPGRWATVDGIIPFQLYRILCAATNAAEARERLNLSRGINLAFAGGEGDGPRMIQQALREAYPEGEHHG